MDLSKFQNLLTASRVEFPLCIAVPPSADLTRRGGFARLKVAAGLMESVRYVSRAEVAELADARGSGPRTRKGVGVRVPSSAPKFQSDDLGRTLRSVLLFVGVCWLRLTTASGRWRAFHFGHTYSLEGI
jgi:hypothetical protein